MKIGIFDSGLGGLIIAKSIFKKLPKYDYIYLGDTKNLPYGSKTQRQIFEYTKNAVDYLFKQNCGLVIVACNTSSALALRKIQQEYLPKHYPNRRVLGVVIPTLETAKGKSIGVLATTATVKSHIYKKELLKIDSRAKIYEVPAPKLVEYIEQNALPKAENALKLYLKPLQQKGIEALVFGCTHYPFLKRAAKNILGQKVKIVSQDEIIPGKLSGYLNRHPEISSRISKNHQRQFSVTKVNAGFKKVAKRLFGKEIKLNLAKI